MDSMTGMHDMVVPSWRWAWGGGMHRNQGGVSIVRGSGL